MILKNAAEWLAWAGVVVPLITLAASSVALTLNLRQRYNKNRHERLFELMSYLDDSERPIASKTAAMYELRNFKNDAAFVVRFCDHLPSLVHGPAAEVLIEEARRTAAHLRKYVR